MKIPWEACPACSIWPSDALRIGFWSFGSRGFARGPKQKPRKHTKQNSHCHRWKPKFALGFIHVFCGKKSRWRPSGSLFASVGKRSQGVAVAQGIQNALRGGCLAVFGGSTKKQRGTKWIPWRNPKNGKAVSKKKTSNCGDVLLKKNEFRNGV